MDSSRILGSCNYEKGDQNDVPSSLNTTRWQPSCSHPAKHHTRIFSLTQHKNLTDTEAKTAKRKPAVFMVDDDSKRIGLIDFVSDVAL
jgi:hypothetical protein